MLSGALVERRVAAVPQEAVHQGAAVREAVIPLRVPHREILAVVAVAPAVMTMIIMHRAAVVEAAEDSFWSQNLQNFQNLINLLGSNGSQPLAVATPTDAGH